MMIGKSVRRLIKAHQKSVVSLRAFSEVGEPQTPNPYLYDHINMFLKSQKQNAPIPPRLKASDANLSKIIDM